MDARTFVKDDSGVENAVYGILMIAIVVMVALLIASLVLSQGGEVQVLASSPTASMTGVLTGGASPTLLINHESGDPLQVGQMILNVYDDNGTLIGMTTVSSIVPAVTPSQLNPGMQTSAIPLALNAGKTVDKGSRYTVKVVSTQTKQQIGSIIVVAR
jgi:FlaG/FlaF family flagellin (archaellin)